MKNRQAFYAEMRKLAVPITLQSVFMALLQLTDQLMVGRLGEETIAAVGIGGRLYYVLSVVLVSVGTAVSVFAAQFWGKKDTRSLGQLLGLGLALGLSFAIVCFGAFFFVPDPFVRLFTNDGTVAAIGSDYVRIVSLSYLPTTLTLLYSAILRSTGTVKVPMYINIAAVLVNALLNYLLIFGPGPLPALGVEGSALATVIARYLEASLLIGFVYVRRLPGSCRLRELVGFTRQLAAPFLRIAYPLLLTELLWVLGETAYAAIYGRLGTAALTAITLSGPIQLIGIGLMSGLSGAAGVMIGNRIGAGEADRASEDAARFAKLAFGAAVLLGGLIALLSPFYVSAYSLSEETRREAIAVLLVFALFFCVKVTNMVVAGGILNSGGDSKYIFRMEAGVVWTVGVPLGLVAAFVWKLPVHWVYFLLSSEELVRLYFGLRRMRSRKWMNDLATSASGAGASM